MAIAKGSYHFRINHLETKGKGIGERITSSTFQVGSHDWAILYYPQGIRRHNKYVSVFLKLQRESINVNATYQFSMLDKHGNIGLTSSKESSQTFTSENKYWGFSAFLKRTELEETYLKDGYLILNVAITVNDESYTKACMNSNSIGFPCERLQEFREKNKHTDVTFDVDGKTFDAHRLILALHSPVFEAELFGSMAESDMKCISILEMMPSIFKAMLDFMYNGSMSANKETIDGEELMPSTSFYQHLLAAADRYAVEKLKAMCQQKLVENISLDTVLNFLELAENHSCSELKKKCLQFIVAKDNLVSLALTEGYIVLMHNYPSLLSELKEMDDVYFGEEMKWYNITSDRSFLL